MITRPGFGAYMREAARRRRLVVQPRMGFSRIDTMRAGLCSVKNATDAVPRIGTVTIDAYTRVGQIEQATAALREGHDLNGFPIVSHGPEATLQMLEGLREGSFPVQVRHGSAFPFPVFKASAEAGFDAIEGGPVSYNLPYSRAPLDKTVAAWADATRFWAEYGQREGCVTHLETFGGSMFGQLCPPSLLVALSVLEGSFFVEQGIESLSLSLAQGTNDAQDVGAIMALSRLARHYFPNIDWHIVFYTFMGLFPKTPKGAEAIIRDSARIAVLGGAHRLIVKTAGEAQGIPTVAQNIEALRWARETADLTVGEPTPEASEWAATVMDEADRLISATMSSAPTVATAINVAFAAGLLDVPYCPHPNNKNVARAAIHSESGALIWAAVGAMPIQSVLPRGTQIRLDSAQFHAMLEFNRQHYDGLCDTGTKEPSHA